MSGDPVERRLAGLAVRTAALRARPGFSARVMHAVALEAAAFPLELARSARFVVPIAMLFALLSIGWASRSDGVTSAELSRAELAWELGW
ncbi:MAG TPA: hypothetical protein VGK73_40070 [Polyangiaceae bacterium]